MPDMKSAFLKQIDDVIDEFHAIDQKTTFRDFGDVTFSPLGKLCTGTLLRSAEVRARGRAITLTSMPIQRSCPSGSGGR